MWCLQCFFCMYSYVCDSQRNTGTSWSACGRLLKATLVQPSRGSAAGVSLLEARDRTRRPAPDSSLVVSWMRRSSRSTRTREIEFSTVYCNVQVVFEDQKHTQGVWVWMSEWVSDYWLARGDATISYTLREADQKLILRGAARVPTVNTEERCFTIYLFIHTILTYRHRSLEQEMTRTIKPVSYNTNLNLINVLCYNLRRISLEKLLASAPQSAARP